MSTTKKPAEPLTPAEVEMLTQFVEERQATLLAAVNDLIATQAATLDQRITAVDQRVTAEAEASVKWGQKVALRMAGGQVLCADQGGPTVEKQPVTFSSRTTAAAHESYGLEKGQG